MAGGERRYTDSVPYDVEVRLRELCLELPEAYEERAWVGTRWKVRSRTFAHVLGVEVDDLGANVVLSFRSAGEELEMLRRAGHPFFVLGWGRDALGMVLDDDTDWSEVAELVTESFCVMAPKKLVALVDRPRTFEPSLGGDAPTRVPPGLPTAVPDWREGDAPALRATIELTPENALPRIGAPALRALASIGITRLEQVAGRSQAELLSLHGFGPRALRILDEALAERGHSSCP